MALTSLLEGNEKNFLEKFATPALGFFRSPTIAAVFAMWEGDFDTLGGDLRESCSRAYAQVRQAGLDIDRLEVDECRMLIGNMTERTLNALKSGFVRGDQHLNAESISRALQKARGVTFFLYTGENDSSVNSLALTALARSPKVSYFHFPSHGHSAWRFEPKIWERLMRE